MIPSQMLKGVLQGSVLAILSQRETYGYEIVQALRPTASAPSPRGRCTPSFCGWKRGGSSRPGSGTLPWPPTEVLRPDRAGPGRTGPVPRQFPGHGRCGGPAAWLCPGKGGDPMNPTVRKLLRQNNAREKALSPESQAGMTDVVVYLRGQDLSRLAQEEIRRDILEMVLAGEARGQTMQQVIGLDYRTFCDEIVAAVPRRPRGVRMLSAVDDMLPAVTLLLAIWTAQKILSALLTGSRCSGSPSPWGRGSAWPASWRWRWLGDLGLPHRSPPAPGGGGGGAGGPVEGLSAGAGGVRGPLPAPGDSPPAPGDPLDAGGGGGDPAAPVGQRAA